MLGTLKHLKTEFVFFFIQQILYSKPSPRGGYAQEREGERPRERRNTQDWLSPKVRVSKKKSLSNKLLDKYTDTHQRSSASTGSSVYFELLQ